MPKNPSSRDPSRTYFLRRAFGADVRRRMTAVSRELEAQLTLLGVASRRTRPEPVLPGASARTLVTVGNARTFVRNTASAQVGDLGEALLIDHLGLRSLLPPGKRQNPLDLFDPKTGDGYEVKVVTTAAKEYKIKMKAAEARSKEAYAKKNKLRPNMMMVVMDADRGEAYAYSRPGIGSYRLTEKDWTFRGKVSLGTPTRNAVENAQGFFDHAGRPGMRGGSAPRAYTGVAGGAWIDELSSDEVNDKVKNVIKKAGLTEAEYHAVDHWKLSARSVQDADRGDTRFAELRNDFYSACTKLGPTPGVAYRGISMPSESISALQVGTVLDTKHASSYTSSQSVARIYAKDAVRSKQQAVVFEVTARSAVDISKLQIRDVDKERVLLKGTNIRVTGLRVEKNIMYVSAEEQ